MDKITKRLISMSKEASTWAALAGGVAILMGRDPAMASDMALQVFGGLSALAGILLKEKAND